MAAGMQNLLVGALPLGLGCVGLLHLEDHLAARMPFLQILVCGPACVSQHVMPMIWKELTLGMSSVFRLSHMPVTTGT